MKIKQWPLHRWLEIGLVVPFVLAGLAIALSNEYAVLNWFLTDDAFYYFKVAQNIAEGSGSTFDGVNLTNGYHPLWMLVCIPVFALGRIDLVLPLRVVILISVGLGAGSAVLLFRMLRQFIEDWLAFGITVLWAFTWSFFRMTTMGGMESILSAFFILLLWIHVTRINQQEAVTLSQIWIVGVIAIFTFLSRLDNIFLVFFAGVWVWLRWWQPVQTGDTPGQRWWWRVRTGVAYYLPVTLILLVYLVFNQMLFGTAMPISSQVKVWWGTLGLTIYGGPLYTYPEYIFEYLLPVRRGVWPWELVTGPIHQIAEGAWKGLGRKFTLEPLAITYAVLGLLFAAIIFSGRKQFFQLSRKLGLWALLAACLVQSMYYFWRDAYHLREWYWISQNLFLQILLGVGVSVLFGYVRKWRYAKIALTVAVVAVTAVTMVNFGRLAIKNTYPGLADTPHYYQQRADAIRENTDSDDVIAAIGSGSIGYFLPEYQVVNLDGLINSVDYFENLKAGTAIQFLQGMGVDYIVGKEYLVMVARPYGDNLAAYLTPYAAFSLGKEEWQLWQVAGP